MREAIATSIHLLGRYQAAKIFGVTFQCDSKFSVRVKKKLTKANKSLYILITLHKEGLNRSEIDLLFNTIALPNINYLSAPRPSAIVHQCNVS